MAHFFLVDHSLKDVGGHHFDYAHNLLRAAEAQGYDCVLAAHRRFRSRRSLPNAWRVFPLFRHDTYSRHAAFGTSRSRPNSFNPTFGAQENSSAAPPAASWLHGVRTWWREADRRQIIHRFAAACERLFGHFHLTADDEVLFPTLSEFDFHGLVEFLERSSASLAPSWRLQFQFNFLDGRDPDYDAQEQKLASMQRSFRQLLARVPHHRLSFYNPSEELRRQYERLRTARFQAVAYPVSPRFKAAKESRPSDEGLRITCAGAVRREKGQKQLARVVDELWDDYFSCGKARLVVQSRKWWFRVRLPQRAGKAALQRNPVTYRKHPLPPEEYASLIRNADIGLLLYNSARYYTRCAGVLIELLAAGAPVIVPAGCWLAEQVAEPIFQHLDALLERCILNRCTLESRSHRAGGASDAALFGAAFSAGAVRCGGSQEQAAGAVPAPPEASDLVIRFRWREPQRAGLYVRIGAEFYGASGERRGASAAIVGRRAGGRAASTMIHLPAGTANVRLVWENAYHPSRIELSDVETWFLAPPLGKSHHPGGAVGLIAAEPEEAANLLRDMIEHYAHYKETANQFAIGWAKEHDGRRTLSQFLRSNEKSQEPAQLIV
jgi:glycosyltransferase involved in cell wall biosynthesis